MHENVERAFDEFFAYFGLFAGCTMSVIDNFLKKDLTEEERITIKDRNVRSDIDAFGKAQNFFGF